MHDCGPRKGFKKRKDAGDLPPESCGSLGGQRGTPEYSDAENLVLRYGQCVEGCMTRMITGELCGQAPSANISDKKALALEELAKARMEKFAFVGLTERWSESMCLFSK